VDERDVQTVDPRHRLIGLVVVPMEMPARGEQEVAAAHRHRITVDHRPHALALALALALEAERVLGVTMLRRGLLRPEVLDGRPQRRRHVRDTAEAGVGQRDRAAFPAAADGHEVAGPLRQRVQRRPLPDEGNGLRRRRHRHQVGQLGP